MLGCGTNDLEFDKFDSIFQNVKKFLSIVSRTNSLLLGIPFRYDPDNSLEVNCKIHQINKKLQKLTRVFPNTSFLETANDSELFTKHGLHRSKLGKKLTDTKITSCILTVLQSRILSPLPSKWHGLADTELHSDSSQSATSIRISDCFIYIYKKGYLIRCFFMVKSEVTRLPLSTQIRCKNDPNKECTNPNSKKHIAEGNYTNFQTSHSSLRSNPENIKIFHQNIRGLRHKADELLIALSNINPLVLCLSEHHLSNDEIKYMHMNQYSLGAYFSRSKYTRGGVAICVLDDILFHDLDLTLYTKEKDFEACAIKLHNLSINLLILCIYRSPSGDFTIFLNNWSKF